MPELSRFERMRPDIVMPFLSYFITAVAAALRRARRAIFNQGTLTSGFLDDPDLPGGSPAAPAVCAVARFTAVPTRWS
jgi:hypothetical protein